MIIVRPAEEYDVPVVAARMRKRDIDEVFAASGYDPQTALHKSLDASSKVWTLVTPEGEPFALFGVAPLSPSMGAPWLLATYHFGTHVRDVLRLTPRYIEEMHEACGHLVNYVDLRNTDSLRYLRWAGFSFTGVELEYGYSRLPFIRFERATNV